MIVKICGVCRPEDAAAAASAGAGSIGVILGAPSARRRDLEAAAAIYDAAPGVARAGVFADTAAGSVIAFARSLRLDIVQLHGAETVETIEAVRNAGPWAVWKAVHPRSADEFLAAVAGPGAAVDGLLVDGWSADALGGTGAAAPWSLLGPLRERVPAGVRLILAGGLTPDNVAGAIAQLRPDVVDVSSGVERVVGEKSEEKMHAFITAANGARRSGIES